MTFHLIAGFAAAAGGVIVMRRMAEEYNLLARRTIRHCAACGRRLPADCRCRDTV